MPVPLASAFVRLRPNADDGEFRKAGQRVGAAAGDEAGKGLVRGSTAQLRAANGQFVQGGQKSGQGFADGFYRDASGRLRQANGRFATDAQKRMVEGGAASGRGFGTSFNREGGNIITRGFTKLRGELGPLLVPLGVGAAVLAIGKIGMEYEDNLNILQSVTKATGAEMEKVAAQARALGADVKLPGVSAAGAAAAMTELAKAGFTVQESMDAARGTLQLARVANLSEADAAEIAANAVNAFGISAKDTMFVVDELAAAANSSSIEISEASLSFKMAAAVFSGVQGPAVGSKEAITELNTAVAILGNNGIKGSDAGTSLKQMLLQLTGPTQQAKGQMQLLAARAMDANISLEQQNDVLHGSKAVRDKALASIMKMNPALKGTGDIAYDAAGRMRPLRDIIDLVAKGTAGMTQEEKNYAITQIFGADASRSVLALLKGGIPVYDKQREAVLRVGAAADTAAAKNAGLRGAIDNVKGQMENAAIAIYEVVKGPLTSGLNGLANVLAPLAGHIATTAAFIRDNTETIKSWAIAIGLVTAALRVNSAMLAVQAAGGLLAYARSVGIVSGTTRAWAAVQTYLNATLIANPIGIVIVAIAALVAGVILAYRHSETFRKIVQAAWAGIRVAATATAQWFMTYVWPVMKAVWEGIATGAMWLWNKAIKPAFAGIALAVKASIATTMIALGALKAFFEKVIMPVVRFLWRSVFEPAFKAISKVVEVAWFIIKIALAAMKLYIEKFLIPTIKFLYNNVVKPIFAAFGATVKFWWEQVLRPTFNNVKNAFETVGKFIGDVWRVKIAPVFNALGKFIEDKVVPGFKRGTEMIKKAWEKVKDYALTPVRFVVTSVINPFIGGLNNAAKIVGIKERIAPIAGFADGGQIGHASGGKISGAGGFSDNRQAMVAGLGPVQLMGGEFVVNREDTRKALPLLRWVNAGMKGGIDRITQYLGRPLTREPGDGSEGWAFKDGGLVGWVKDVWGAVSNPIDTIKKPFENMLARIPGAGMIRDFLVGSAKKLLGGAVGWLTGGGGGGNFASGNVGAAQRFVTAQNGKPYVWASAGPGGYDCSGIVSAAYNILKGRNPYSHTFSTGGLPGPWFARGRRAGAIVDGWSHPVQSPASTRVGHMAGRIGNLPFESRGSRGVVIGRAARPVTSFANIGAARLASGGQVTPKLFDGGGPWDSGVLGLNASGHTEHVMTGGPGGDMEQMLDLLAEQNRILLGLGVDIVEAQRVGARRTARAARGQGRTTGGMP